MLSTVPEAAPTIASRFDEYRGPAGAYDEFRDKNGQIRPHWKRILNAFQFHGPVNPQDRWDSANRLLQENGVNFTGDGRDGETQRPWTLDLLPIVYSSSDWQQVQAGIAQRARLIDAICRDLYGPQTILKDGLLPPELVFRNRDFVRAFHNLPASSCPLVFYGCELARSESGQFWIMADRAAAPAGISFAVENRVALSKSLPQFLHQCQIHRLAPYFVQLQESLKKYSRQRKGNPSVVILSGGVEHPYYYEDVFLARYLGYPLIEADDLTVRRQQVWIKTLRGLTPVDVVLRRTPDQNIDPLEINSYSPNGIAGLLNTIRKKNVTVANGPQTGLLDSPVYMPFLPPLCRRLLGEELKLPSIATWWCGQKEPLAYTLENLHKLVIKPAFSHSGGQEIVVSELSQTDRNGLKERIRSAPEEFIAQEKVVRSTAPCWVDGAIRPGHIALRTFAVKRDDEFEVMNGGLVRVETSSVPMKLSVAAGEFSKDVWVCSETPVPPVTLLGHMLESPKLERANSRLPSRAGDNLFWFGRNLERLEFAGRLIRKITERLMSESAQQPIQDIMPLVACLAQQGLIEESFSLPEFTPSRDEFERNWPKMIWHGKQTSPFESLCQQVRQTASVIRDRMTEDFWRAVSQIENRIRPADETDLSELLAAMNLLMLQTSATTGQITDGLIHGPTRHFIMIGRCLERALQLHTIVSQFLARNRNQESLPIVTLLDVCNSLMTYRNRYRANFAILPACDLLVTDTSNPHALIFQFRELYDMIGDLPIKQKKPFLAPELDLTRRTVSELQSLLPASNQELTWPRYREGLEPVLQTVRTRIDSISELLTQRYFLHAEFTQQMEDTREGTPQ